MKNKLFLQTLKKLGKRLGYKLIDAESPSELLLELLQYREGGDAISRSREQEFLAFVLRHYRDSHAQIFQDLFVLFSVGEKREGFFVEFGATDGITLSNTFLLEKSYGWNGILAEPARGWHEQLRHNRGCHIDTRCVWSKSEEELHFNEAAERELSTIEGFSDTTGRSKAERHYERYVVQSISLNDLLESHDAPRHIDYLSIDTEGSELSILSGFDFSCHDIHVITVEHNRTPERKKIHGLLQSKGYVRIFEGFSQWDDWFIKSA